jgi:hypothetical protein
VKPSYVKTLRELLKTKQAAALLEIRWLQELASAMPATTNGRKEATKSVAAPSRRRSLKCPRCERRFARPVHLGRHMSATHGVKKKKAA